MFHFMNSYSKWQSKILKVRGKNCKKNSFQITFAEIPSNETS